MPAECEIDVNGKPCGVQAVGRCVTCGKAFCSTHQARNATTYYVDMCAPCFAKSPQEVALLERETFERENWAAHDYL